MDNSLLPIMSEVLISLTIRRLEEGTYLATSDTIQGLIAEGRTIAETIEIAQDVGRKLIESYIEHGDPLPSGLQKPPETVSSISVPIFIKA